MANLQGSAEVNVAEYQQRFVDTLESFLEQCYILVEHQQDARGKMSEEERIAKIQAVTNLIKEKEVELRALEAERDALNAMAGQGTYKCRDDCLAECK